MIIFGQGQCDLRHSVRRRDNTTKVVIWRMPIGGTYQVLYNFLGTNQPGQFPPMGPIPKVDFALGPDGTIYGTTSFGGDPSGDGTALVDQAHQWHLGLQPNLQVQRQHRGGSLPHKRSHLGFRTAPLYGTTAGGPGPLWRRPRSTSWCPTAAPWTYVTLHNFIPRDPNGDSPYGDLLYANNNFLRA